MKDHSAEIDALLQKSMEAWKVPGASVAVVQGDEVVYLKGSGVRDIGTGQPVTPDTLFAIGSTTKAFTTTAIAMLVEDGKMGWDDSVRKYLPFFRLSDPLADENVTVRDLVTHGSGLNRHDMLWYGSPWRREEIIRRIGSVKLDHSFRSKWSYQNIMYLAAGLAVGAASGSTWEDVLQQRILDPLGMAGANFSTTVAEKAPDHATPHRKNKEEKIEVIPWRNLDNIAPAGSINAGARDMSKWVRFLLGDGVFEGKRLISAANLAETFTPQIVMRMDENARAMDPETNLMCYGLGWTVQDYRGRLLITHGGGIDGFRARVALVPHAKLGLVILSNLGNSQMPEALSHSLTDLLLDLPKRDWNAHLLEHAKKMQAEGKTRETEREEKRRKRTKPSRELAAYAGAYEEPAYGTASISLENRALTLQWSSFTKALEHWHFDTFTAKGEGPLENEQVVFTLDADGEVAALKFLGREFTKVKPKTKD
jgi:CubicO group peptidase (beta-lactamase class C family)